MKVCLLADGFGLGRKDVFGPLSELISEIGGLGNEVVVVARKGRVATGLDLVHKNIRVYQVAQGSGKWRNILFMYEYIKMALKVSKGSDVINSHILGYSGLCGLVVSRMTGIAWTHWLCTDGAAQFKSSRWQDWIRSWIVFFLIHIYADRIISCCHG